MNRPIEGINAFLCHHIEGHERKDTIKFVNRFALINKDKIKSKSPIKYIQENFSDFRNWFFDKKRERLKIEL